MSKKKKQKNKTTVNASKPKSIAAEQSNTSQVNTVAETAVAQTSDSGQYSPEQVDAVIDELAATPKRQRIWEVDFLRGLMILFVVWDHFMWNVRYAFSSNYNTALFQWLYTLSIRYYGGSLRAVTHDVFVTMFVLTSGISCSFSRSNGKRAIKMCCFAVLFSVITYVSSLIFNDPSLTFYFNVIHVVALSVLLYTGIEWIWSKLTKNWQKNIFGVLFFAVTMTALVVGHCAKDMNVNWIDLIFGSSEWRTAILAKFKSGGDYLSFLLDFGWFLVGAFLGKVIYREKKTVFPSVNPKYVVPFTFCGKYSIWIYFASEVVMWGLIYLFHVVWSIM